MINGKRGTSFSRRGEYQVKKIWRKRSRIFIIVGLCMLAIYTIWDNNRITIVKQDIVMDGLPNELEGFTILQIADLHEKEFGENQSSLIEAINSQYYDVIVFTGDMLRNKNRTDYTSFYSLLDGIEKKDVAYFVSGNTDPDSYRVTPYFEKSAFIRGMEERGVQLLESIDTIQIGSAKVYITYFELAILNEISPETIDNIAYYPDEPYGRSREYVAYQGKLLLELQEALKRKSASDLLIALNHFPVVDERVDEIIDSTFLSWQNFDLIISGHYHGGQIRVPVLGAVFVPESWYRSGFFPPQDRVKGLWEYYNTKHYVSTGLGSSNAVSFLNFRLFNSPEINVITFTGG